VNRLDSFLAGVHAMDRPAWYVANEDQSTVALRELFARDGIDLDDPAQARAAVAAVLWANALIDDNDGNWSGVLRGLAVTLAQMAAEAGRADR
jgi:hypothetical protein